jgi:uncharacterized protein (DUF1800 family)
MAASMHRLASIALVALCATAACVAPGEEEDTGEVASDLVDAVDPRCAAAFTDADRTKILAAIQASDLAPRERVSHALNRFGFGDRFAGTALPVDTATTLSTAIHQSLRNGPSIAAPARTAMDAALPNLARPAGDLHLQFRQLYISRDQALKAGNATLAATLNAQITALRDAVLDELAGKQMMAATLAPDIGLGERLTSFWLNHFNVDGRVVAIWAPAYERTIRMGVCGTFEEMLKAVARSPAMLRYLDNYASTAPGTVHWSGATNINENYARELLELHTLGTGARTPTNPSSPYVQADVIQTALTLTGWAYTYAADNRSTSFQFQSQYHAAGTKPVMGVNYAPGEASGLALLNRLSTLPQTKGFICTKLARQFFAAPPATVVNACVAAWGTTGALPRMYVAILSHPDTWKAAQYGNKIKNPFELVVSSHRLSGDIESTLTAARVKAAVLAMRTMGLPLWRIDPPTGYSSNHLDWLDPGYLNEQVAYVYGQSDPLGLKYGATTGLAVENQFAAMSQTPAQKLQIARTSVLPIRAVSYPTALDDVFLATAFTDPDRAPATTAPSRPIRSLLSFYATSWQFLLQ